MVASIAANTNPNEAGATSGTFTVTQANSRGGPIAVPNTTAPTPKTTEPKTMLTRSTKNLIFIDSRVPDAHNLAQGAIPEARTVVLKGDTDNLKQITETLARYQDLESVHIVSHGDSGCLYFAKGQLDINNIEEYAPLLEQWRGAAVSSILLYGCNVAQGPQGVEFIEKLHQLTGAKVAASATRTGSKELGGNWELETSTHPMAVGLGFEPGAMASYRGVLPVIVGANEYVVATDAIDARSVFAADADGDGDVDIFIASRGDNTIAWYENNGSNIYTEHIISNTASGAQFVLAVDVDSDGDVDVLGANYFDKIAWYENDGSNNYTENVISTNVDDARSIFTADADDDGDLDIFSASENDDKIAWYENDGSNNYTQHVISTNADGTESVFAADADGDGDVDVFSSSHYDNKIAWYENDGLNNYTENVISTNADDAYSVFVADADGDGDVDVFSASEVDDKIAWYENDGSGGYTENVISTNANGAASVFATDADGDGDVDVFSASLFDNKIAWYENDGSNNYTENVISTNANGAFSVFAADADGDGDVDVFSASRFDHTIAWYETISPPVLTNLDPAIFTESAVNSAAQIIDSDVLLTEDANNTDFNGGNVTVTYSVGGGVEDQLAVANIGTGVGQIGFDGSNVTYEGNIIGGIDILAGGASGADLLINFTTADATVAAVDALIQALSYQNTSDNPTASRTISITVNDGAADSAAQTAEITVTADNDAPVLDNTLDATGATADIVLTAVDEDPGVPTGAVGSLITDIVALSSNVTDIDTGAVTGIALTAADTTNGVWHYTTDGGTTWNLVGAVSDASALLLAADANNRLYFEPAVDYNGTIANAITFRAWDQASGTAGTKADTSVNGGSTAFSTATDTASIAVNAVNDDPVITAPASATVLEDTATAISGISLADADSDPNNITVTLSVGTGTINVADTVGGGLTAGNITNNGTASVTLTGTVGAINTTLADASGLTYTTAVDDETAQTLTITANDDGNTGTGGGTNILATVPLTVTNNDIDHTTAAVAANFNENNGTTSIFTIDRTGATDQPSSIDIAFSGVATENIDYNNITATGTGVSLAGNTISFAAASTQATVGVDIIDDSEDEGTGEDIVITLSNPATTSTDSAANLVTATDTTTILDNDTTGVTVGTISGNTDETGTTATFTVILDSQPTADVVIPLTSDTPAEGTPDVTDLTFTNANWNLAQTVTVTGVDDFIDDGDIPYNILLGAATSTDANYSAFDAADVAVTNIDNDAAGITVGTISGDTDETGTTATFTVILDSQPTADVVIPVSSDTSTEGTPDVTDLTFTNANWNLAQTVTLTGVDDFIDDGDIPYNILLGAATSTDANYSAFDAADVAVTNIDNDTTGVTVGTISGDTDETGTTATFTVILDSQPTADVVIPVSSDTSTEGTPNVSSLTFTNANWNLAQTVTVTGVDDSVDDGDVAYNIVLGASTSSDPIYNGVGPDSVAVTNINDDIAGITIDDILTGNTGEDGTTTAFDIFFDSQPTADVTIPISSDNPAEGTPNVSSLTFTNANWNLAQTVTVTGVDDSVDDGDVAYNIVLGASTSSDPIYNGVGPDSVAVTNINDDIAGITIDDILTGNTGEDGTTTAFDIFFDSQPTADVTIPISSDNPAEGTPNVSSLTFTNANWNLAQTVTVTGVDDSVDDGDVAYNIVLGASTSSDPIYNGVGPDSVAVTNINDDIAGITVGTISGNTDETGTTATFTVILDSQPTADVVIPLTSDNPAEGTPDVSSLTFTNANWNLAQTVTVTGVDDGVGDGDIPYNILLGAATSIDTNYSAFDAADVAVTNINDDIAGITIDDILTGNTGEDGTTATFTVILDSQPTADVTIPISSDNPAEGTPDVSSLTFTNANWNVAQTVTVTGVDDSVDDGDIAYNILLGTSTSSDPIYNGVGPDSVAVTNINDDIAGITVGTISGNTDETGTTATFTVILDSQPTADVVIPLTSDNPAEGTPDVSSLTFTPTNWNLAQTVTVTGVDDGVGDGDIPYNILLGAATSIDTNYSAFDAADVAVTNIDNDTAGVTVGTISGNTDETGTTATFTVILDSQPTADVVIPVTSDNPAEGTPDVSSLTFTNANWNLAQTVTVTGVDDGVGDGDIPYNILLGAATSIDTNYSAFDAADVAVTNIDNDTAGVTVGTISGNTDETGTTATFTVILDSQPTADVVIPVTSDNPAEGTPDVSSLTFTNANWNATQTVTVTGVDDSVGDGDIPYNIVLGAATSSDANYSAFDAADVAVTNIDNDTAGVTVGTISGNTDETGTTATFTVILDSQPTADVVIPVTSDNPAEGTPDVSSLTFTPTNWNLAQTVTVTGVDDGVGDGDIPYNILLGAATSIDTNYSAFDAADVAVTNIDNDTTGVTVGTISGNTSENGTSGTFTVVLDSQPTADVVIPVTSSDTTEGTPDVSSLTFTPTNWNLAQTVTVTGVDDDTDDGDIPYNIVLGAATSSDTNYSAFDAADVAVTNIDNDTAGITVGTISGNTSENGTSGTFTVVLDSQPTADVTIDVSSNDATEGTVDVNQLTFTAENWETPKTVTVTGLDDSEADGDVAYSIAIAPATSSDANYNGLDANDINVTNEDNDQTGIIVSPISNNTAEDGTTGTFTVVLGSQPTGDVNLELSTSDTTEGTIGQNSLNFTATNWNSPQTVTVTGIDDDLADGDILYNILISATSSDPNYSEAEVGDISLTNLDNETTGITVSPISNNTSEDGTTGTFSLVLNSQPIADVTIDINSDNTAEGTVDKNQLTFTADNWETPQTVTVTGVDDDLADGPVSYNIVTAVAVSEDGNYNGLDVADVTVNNLDDELEFGIIVGPISNNTSEEGTNATFTINLASQPTADVTIGLSSEDTTEGTIGKNTLTFTPDNWDTVQTVTVTGVDDLINDGDISYTILTTAAVSSDSDYSGLDAVDVGVTNLDNENSGISVTPISNNTAEDGTTGTFTIVLDSQPTADVTIDILSDTPTEGTVDKQQLTFTAENWETPQTVTVTGVDDELSDGEIEYGISLTSNSSDANYSELTSEVTLTNTDNDNSGISVTPISNNTAEDGTTGTFTVVLDSQPTNDVTIDILSDTPTEGTVDKQQLTFTAENWETPQTVTVTGVDDELEDGEIEYSIALTTTSSDTDYEGLTSEVTLTNTDNDNSGISVTPISNNTAEDGTTGTFTIVLDSQPTADVTIDILSDTPTEGTVDKQQLTFTAENWETPQTVTVTGVDDELSDGDVEYGIGLTTTSSDTNYEGLTSEVTLTNTDNDNSGISVTPISNNTAEDGTTGTFSLVLNSQPTADVTVDILSDTPTEGTVDKQLLTFTAENWETPQTVTVTGVDDELEDGEIEYGISLTSTSSDANYSELTSEVTLTNTDNDNSGISVTPISNNTAEDGTTGTFSLVLNSQPTADVTVDILSDTPTEGTVDKQLLTFTAENWETPQTVTVTGVDDELEDGDVEYGISLTSTSSDTDYEGLTSEVTLTNTDNDNSGISVTPISNNTAEDGTSGTFTVVLDSQPTADVTIDILSDTPTEGTVDKQQLTFTAENWETPQTVTVTGVDDELEDGDVEYGISLTTTSDDANYSELTSEVTLTNTDNDNSGISVTPISNNTAEDGTTGTFSLVLNSQPTADVTVDILSDTPTEGTVDKQLLTFTAENWETPQTVTVTGVDDELEDGEVEYGISLTSTSSDTDYEGLTSEVTLTNTDNDNSGISVTPISNNTAEDGTTGTFTIVLDSQPTADVTVDILSDTPTEGTVDKQLLTFTAENWETPQTVTVTGVDDELEDGEIEYGISLTSTSSDTDYEGLTSEVTLTNTDNDNSGISVTPISNNTAEDGTTGTFTIVLDSQPTADVTVDILSDTPTEGTVDKQLLTFTAENWETPQTVTVTGVDDELEDGDVEYGISLTSTSSDTDYEGLTSEVTLTNTDNDNSGISVTPISNNTAEDGTTGTFSLVLNSQPTADVTVDILSDTPTEGTVDKQQLTFTAENWETPQTVTVTGVDDELEDGEIEYGISLTSTSDDANYSELTSEVTLTNTDNDNSGISVTPISNNTAEDGTTGTFSLVLNSQPTADVTVDILSDTPTEGTVDKQLLTFTAENWETPQTVTVTGVDDELEDGEIEYGISLTSTSSDTNYEGLTSEVTLTNTDNDNSGISVTPISNNTAEDGTSGTFTVVLDSQPTADVTIDILSDTPTEGTVDKQLLTFTAENWETPQTVTVTGVDDELEDGEIEYGISLTTTSSDINYEGLTSEVSLSNSDDEEPDDEEPDDEEPVDEEPEEPDDEEPDDEEPDDEEPVDEEPEEPVDEEPVDEEPVDEEPDDEEPVDEEPVDEEPVDEEPDDEEPVDEEPEEPDDEEPVDEEPEEPDDEEPVDEEPEEPDDEEPVDEEPEEPDDEEPAGVKLVLPVDRLDVIEGTESDRYKIVLESKPTANVTITVTSDRQTKIDITEVVFTPNNWDTPQILTVEATDDRSLEELVISSISHTVSSDDPNYDGIDVSELVVNVSDNDNKGENKSLATSESISAVNMTEDDDTVIGSSEKNIVYGKAGNDRLAGEAGNDFLYGKEGADGIYGGDGDDMIYGGIGEDYIKGDRGKDTLFGSEGSDRLFGGGGNDRIFGDEGNDYIEGNAGRDTLTGNSGSDAFAIDLQTGVTNFNKLDQIDLITDFDPQQDRIDIGTMTFKEIKLISGVGNFAGSSVIQNAETQDYLAVLIDVNSNSLDSDNFI